MKLWNADVDIHEPEGESTYFELLFDVPDDLYEKAISALLNGEKLPKDVAQELLDLAEAEFTLDFFEFLQEEEPQHEDYDSEEKYDEALREFCAKEMEYREQCSIASISVNGIGSFLQLQLDYVGKKVSDGAEDDNASGKILSCYEIAFYDASGNLNLIKTTHDEDRDGRITYIEEPSSWVYNKDSVDGTAHRKPTVMDYDRVRKFYDKLVESCSSDN